MKRLASTLLVAMASLMASLIVSCSSAPPVAKPDWPRVPRIVLDGFCLRLRGEGIARDTPIEVFRHTQALIRADSLSSLRNASFKKTDMNFAQLADQLNAASKELVLELPSNGCVWRGIDAIDPRRDADVMVLQLSTPFVNPFGKNEAGLFARLSIGNDSAQWYWIPIARQGEQWGVGLIQPLDMHED